MTFTPRRHHRIFEASNAMNARLAFPLSLAASLIFLLLMPATLPAQETADGGSVFDELVQRLVEDGVDPSVVYSHFDDPRMELIPRLLRVNIKQPDATDAYERFKSDAVAEDVYRYLSEHRVTFDEVLATSKVTPEVVAAILKIESDFGRNQGPFPVLNVFASLTLLESDQLETLAPDFWTRILADVPPTEQEDAVARANHRKAAKARWAYREVKTLLEMAAQDRIDPLAVNGSWAGAYGMAQFLPSSFAAYAADGDGDGLADLDTLPDAIASVANYLSEHRFDPAKPERRRKAVWHYNHSDDYVDAVLTLADKVEAMKENQP